MIEPTTPFFVIVADHDQGFFSVEGPMTDDRPWKDAARNARNNERQIECGPARIVTRSPRITNAPTNSAAFRQELS
jgi:hypothetical protein